MTLHQPINVSILLAVAAIVGYQNHSSFDGESLHTMHESYVFRPVGHLQIHLSTCNELTVMQGKASMKTSCDCWCLLTNLDFPALIVFLSVSS